MRVATQFFDFLDQRRIVRRAMVLVVLWQLVDSYLWAKGYAATTTRTGVEIGLVIAAVLAPVTTLQGFLFRVYDGSRQADAPSSQL